MTIRAAVHERVTGDDGSPSQPKSFVKAVKVELGDVAKVNVGGRK